VATMRDEARTSLATLRARLSGADVL